MLLFFLWELLMLALVVGLTLWFLAAKGTAWHVYLSVWVSWGMALALVALVPIDIHIVYLKRCIDHYGDDVDAQEVACSVSSWRDIAGGDRSAKEVLAEWFTVLQKGWIVVYTVCQVNGWILLTLQSSFIESRRFSFVGKLKQALYENVGFYAALACINSAGLVFFWMMGLDLEYVVISCLALFNALMLVIVSLFLGYGLGEAPRALWQGSRFVPTIRRALYNVWANHRACEQAADELADKLVQVYSLRRAAGGAVRGLAQEIVIIMSEVPFDMTSVFLMDPVKGPFLPSKKDDLKKAYLAQLKQIEMETTHKQKTTEIDLWLQERFFEAGFKDLGALDQLDPALSSKQGPGEERVTDAKTRQDVIMQRLAAIELPGSVHDHKGIALAVIQRNDHTFLNACVEGEEDPWANLEQDQFGAAGCDIRAEDWDTDKLVALRTEVYKANRKYRKSKKKFDRCVKECILIQDLDRAHDELLPWRCVAQNLHRALVYKDRSDKGWDGLKSPVRPVMEGPHALRLEVAYFVARTYVLPFFKQVAAVICGLGALAILQSQMAIFPGLPKRYGLVIVLGIVLQLFNESRSRIPDSTGQVLLDICRRGALEPSCIDAGQDVSSWEAWAPNRILPGFQVTIGWHLFFICGIMMFVLLRLKIFSFYEVVMGETDSASLLLNAYIVCRLAPALAHNYLALVDEAGTESEGRSVDDFPYVTAFESCFGALGKIPVVNIDFNQVLPPLTLLVWLVTVINGLCKGKCKMPRLDGELHKTDDILDDARLVVELERRRYVKSRAQQRVFKSRQAHLASTSSEGLDSSGREGSGALGAGSRLRRALYMVRDKTGVEMALMRSGGGGNGGGGAGGAGDAHGDERKVLAEHDTCAGADGALAAAADVEAGQARKMEVQPSTAATTTTTHHVGGYVVTADEEGGREERQERESDGIGGGGGAARRLGWSAMLRQGKERAEAALKGVDTPASTATEPQPTGALDSSAARPG